MAKNQAAWITEAKGKPFKVQEAPNPKAGPGEVVIKNAAIAINVSGSCIAMCSWWLSYCMATSSISLDVKACALRMPMEASAPHSKTSGEEVGFVRVY